MSLTERFDMVYCLFSSTETCHWNGLLRFLPANRRTLFPERIAQIRRGCRLNVNFTERSILVYIEDQWRLAPATMNAFLADYVLALSSMSSLHCFYSSQGVFNWRIHFFLHWNLFKPQKHQASMNSRAFSHDRFGHLGSSLSQDPRVRGKFRKSGAHQPNSEHMAMSLTISKSPLFDTGNLAHFGLVAWRKRAVLHLLVEYSKSVFFSFVRR